MITVYMYHTLHDENVSIKYSEISSLGMRWICWFINPWKNPRWKYLRFVNPWKYHKQRLVFGDKYLRSIWGGTWSNPLDPSKICEKINWVRVHHFIQTCLCWIPMDSPHLNTKNKVQLKNKNKINREYHTVSDVQPQILGKVPIESAISSMFKS